MQTNTLGIKINNVWKSTRWKFRYNYWELNARPPLKEKQRKGGEVEFTRNTTLGGGATINKSHAFPRAWRCVESRGPDLEGEGVMVVTPQGGLQTALVK